ncbi:MAG: ribose 5-phosphate isomerase [Deltaproteobacteria bacterium SG8_13]|nr:MAG: ribose 5-phosphate isomerase [Deltaproteobacteria bacterium SG8_13]
MSSDTLKQQAARFAVDLIESGMVIGLGSGSTVKFALAEIASRSHSRRIEGILGVPSSSETQRIARKLGLALTSLDEHPQPDINIDGADEVDPQLNLIKGGGGALLREKVLAQSSRRNVIIVDAGKLSQRLGDRWPLPVEVLPFASKSVERFLMSQGARVEIRHLADGRPLRTDQGNTIFDAHFGPIEDPEALAALLSARAGILANGLFIGLTDDLIVADHAGIRHLTRTDAPVFR